MLQIVKFWLWELIQITKVAYHQLAGLELTSLERQVQRLIAVNNTSRRELADPLVATIQTQFLILSTLPNHRSKIWIWLQSSWFKAKLQWTKTRNKNADSMSQQYIRLKHLSSYPTSTRMQSMKRICRITHKAIIMAFIGRVVNASTRRSRREPQIQLLKAYEEQIKQGMTKIKFSPYFVEILIKLKYFFSPKKW